MDFIIALIASCILCFTVWFVGGIFLTIHYSWKKLHDSRMKNTFTTYLEVMDKEGRFLLYDEKRLNDFLKYNTKEKYIVEVVSIRSMSQERYWRVLMRILSSHFGYTPKEMSETAETLFIHYQMPVSHPESTEYFNEKIEFTKQYFAKEFNINLPDSDELNK